MQRSIEDALENQQDRPKEFAGEQLARQSEKQKSDPEVKKPFHVHTGVAHTHLEATFNELDEDGEEHPVAYICPEQLKPRESHYSTTRCLIGCDVGLL